MATTIACLHCNMPLTASVTGLRRFRPVVGLRIMTTVGVTVLLLTAAAMVAGADEPAGATWRGLVVAAEDRCSELRPWRLWRRRSGGRDCQELGWVVVALRRDRVPNQESDREHIVAVAEAHDSGLCAADVDTRQRFGRDLDR